MNSGSLTVVDTRLTGHAGLPLHVRSLTGVGAIADVDPVLRGLTVEGNGVDVLAIDGGILSLDSVWEDAGAPYQVRGQVSIRAPASLTIEPGVEVRFSEGADLYVEGGLVALGTAAQPIRLVGTVDAPGTWRGIQLLGPGSEQARASFAHVMVANAGNVGRPAIDVSNAQLTFLDGQVTKHAADGILFSRAPVIGLIEGSAFTEIGGAGVANPGNQLVLAPNNWWGSSSGPTTNDTCSDGDGTRVEGLVRYGPWLRSAEERPDPLKPLDIPLITLSPQRWYAPADGQTRVWVDVTLLDPMGNPVPGESVNLLSSLGTVTSGGITDAAGHTLAYLTSAEMGDAELTATLSTTNRCAEAASTTSLVTFTDDADGLLAGMKAPYLYSGITVSPAPITRGVPTTIAARLTNPNEHAITVEATFEFVQSGIGLAFGPVGAAQTKEIPAGGEQVFETTWTPVVSGHYCVQVLYRVVGEAGAEGFGPVAAANGPAAPGNVSAFGLGGGGRGQLNLNVYGGGLAPGGGKPGGKPPLEKARKASDLMGGIGSIGTGETFLPGVGVGLLTSWQFDTMEAISRALGFDPPRQDYTIIAEATRTPLPAMPRAPGTSDELFAAQVALAEAMAEAVAVGEAAAISLDRYGGAAAAGNLEWSAVQASSLLHYRKLLGQAAIVAAERMAAVRGVIEREGGSEAGPTAEEVASAQAAVRADGFAQEQIDAAHAIGLTDEEIEAARQRLLNTAPDELAGPLAAKLADAEAAYREMGDYLIAPVNFADEAGREAFNDGMLLAGVVDGSSNLARIYAHSSTIEVGNPLDHETTIELRPRRISMPPEWLVELSPSSVTLKPGEQATITISIEATTPWPQGTRSEVAIEGVAEGQLLGGVVVALLVPASVPFGAVPGGETPFLMIAAAVAGGLLLVILIVGVLFLRRRKRRLKASSATPG